MGSDASVAAMSNSFGIRDAVARGKLDLTYIPANMSTNSQEEISPTHFGSPTNLRLPVPL